MDLLATVGSADTNSYVEMDDAVAIMADDTLIPETSWDTWLDMEVAQQKTCLLLGAAAIDSFRLLGKKACTAQAMEFPRFKPDNDLYDDEYELYSDIDEASRPIVPEGVIIAQVEIAVWTMMDWVKRRWIDGVSPAMLAGLSIPGAVNVSFKAVATGISLGSRDSLGAETSYMLRLRPWIVSVRGGVI
jgi:hypothetical protein